MSSERTNEVLNMIIKDFATQNLGPGVISPVATIWNRVTDMGGIGADEFKVALDEGIKKRWFEFRPNSGPKGLGYITLTDTGYRVSKNPISNRVAPLTVDQLVDNINQILDDRGVSVPNEWTIDLDWRIYLVDIGEENHEALLARNQNESFGDFADARNVIKWGFDLEPYGDPVVEVRFIIDDDTPENHANFLQVLWDFISGAPV